jgi:hypothetical protein
MIYDFCGKADEHQERFNMNEQELQLLITMDDPWYPAEEDTFNHLQASNIEYWFGRLPAWRRLDQRAQAVSNNNAAMVTFSQGDWTCTLSRLTGSTNDSLKALSEPSNKKLDVDVCTITHWNSGEIVEQKVFYDLL